MANPKRSIEVKDQDTGISYVFELHEISLTVQGRVVTRAFKNRGKENELELPQNSQFENPVTLGGTTWSDEDYAKVLEESPELAVHVSKILEAAKKRYI